MENNHITSTDKQPSKHFLSLHISHKGEQKTLHLKKGHAMAICATAALLVFGATASVSSYINAKNALAASQQELQQAAISNRLLQQTTGAAKAADSGENLEELQSQANALLEKIDELESLKNDLNNQLSHISGADAASAVVADAVASCLTEPVTIDVTGFTPIVSTSYDKTTALAVQLEKLDTRLNETGTSFTAVAANVTEALAAYSDIPSGMPVNGILSTAFNPEGLSSVSDGRTHKGIDLSTSSRILPIAATAAGKVVESNFHSGYGNYVLIDHGNGFTTMYAHNSENLVSVGDVVKKGDTIAMTGSTGQSTGIHCHYEIQLNGIYQNPVDYQ